MAVGVDAQTAGGDVDVECGTVAAAAFACRWADMLDRSLDVVVKSLAVPNVDTIGAEAEGDGLRLVDWGWLDVGTIPSLIQV